MTETMPDVASVAAGFWVGTGGRDEAGRLAGASHFLEHLLFKGTPTRSAEAIAREIDSVGGEMNAFTAREYTAFYVRLLAEDLGLGLDILCDIMSAPALRPEEVEAERQVILEEILMHADEPADLVHEVSAGALFPDHPLGRDVLGTEESVSAMGVADIRAFFEQHYQPANMVVAIAGRVDHDHARQALGDRLAAAGGGARPERRPPQVDPNPVAVASRPTEQAHLVAAVRTPGRHDAVRWALDVLNQSLGGGPSSRLFQEVRERRGLAYSVFSDRVAYDDTGALAVYVGTSPGRIRDVAALVREELDRLVAGGVTEAEMAVARGCLRGQILLALEDSGARMSRIGRSQLVHGRVLSVDEVLSRVEAVTLEDVHDAARRVLSGPRTLSVVGP
ncbi:MAG TPA: pitrilysin family protein, partial [Acidimicrobiales bacterium]|nr:pitrilysin family protein [Acidimicrobiales bacterium]